MIQHLTVREAAESRRSIRKFDAAPIPEADLQEILRLAGLAPSAWNLQPWRTLVVRDAQLKSQLAEAAYGQPQVKGAPAVLVVTSDMKQTLANLDAVISPAMQGAAREGVKKSVLGVLGGLPETELEAWGNAQSYLFVGFLLLAAKSLGYDTSPMLGFQPDAVKSLLGLPANVRIPALVALGRGTEPGFPHHRFAPEHITSLR